MPRCWNCGRRSLFIKLSFSGRCYDCERENLRKEEERKKRIIELKAKQEIERQRKLSQFRDYYPLKVDNEQTSSFLSVWDNRIHDDECQLTRQRRALCQAIPIEINTKLCSATFISRYSDKIYKSDLVSCTCADFSERSLPCKHMYRLFYELNHAPSNSKIINVSYLFLDKFESLSDEAKVKFIDFCTYHKLDHPTLMQCTGTMEDLVQTGVLIVSAIIDYNPLLHKLTKDEIILALAKKGISGYRPSWTKVKLIDWVNTTQKTFLEEHFKNYALFQISPDLQEWAEGISTAWRNFQFDTSVDPFSVPSR